MKTLDVGNVGARRVTEALPQYKGSLFTTRNMPLALRSGTERRAADRNTLRKRGREGDRDRATQREERGATHVVLKKVPLT